MENNLWFNTTKGIFFSQLPANRDRVHQFSYEIYKIYGLFYTWKIQILVVCYKFLLYGTLFALLREGIKKNGLFSDVDHISFNTHPPPTKDDIWQ